MAERSRIDTVAVADRQYNSTLNAPSSAMSAEDRATQETALSDASLGIVAKVIYAVGNYVKIKFFYNNKPLAVFKSRNYSQAEALAYLEELKSTYDIYSTLGLDTVGTLDATIDDNTLAPAGTGQMTVENTVGEDDPVDVTADSTYYSTNTAVATVNSAGLVTGVAAATKATGTLTSTGTNPADADTVTLDAQAYRFKNTTAQAYDVKIGASAAITLDNLKAAVNATGTPGTEYHAGTNIHPTVSATTNTNTTQVFEAKTAGTGGNALASTDSGSQLSFGAATLTGGTAGTATIGAQYRGATDTVSVTVDV
jgi:hypothetical protein